MTHPAGGTTRSVATVRLKYLHIYRGRGKAFAYYRRDGARWRLVDEAGAPVDGANAAETAAAWQRANAMFEAAEASARAAGDARMAQPGSVADLIQRYRLADFTRLRPATRKDYEKALKPLEQTYGHCLVAGMKPHHVRQLRDAFATRTVTKPGQAPIVVSNARQANRIVTVLSVLMSFARATLGWRPDNPAERPRKLPSDGEGYRAWTRAQFDQFMACDAVVEPLKRAAALGWYTGQRKGDCLAMTRSARSGGWLEVIPAKTRRSSGARRMVPEHPHLTVILDAAPASAAVTLLTRADGRPWKVDHFNHTFAGAVTAAGLGGLSFHGLRKGMMGYAAEQGATDAELDTVVPHSDPRVRAAYRAAASQTKLAADLIRRLGK